MRWNKEKVAIDFVEWCALNGWEKYPRIDRWKRTWTIDAFGTQITKQEYGATGSEVFRKFLREQNPELCDASKAQESSQR